MTNAIQPDDASPASRAWVREQLVAVRRELEVDLRARRLVIVNDDDQPVIVLSADADVASVMVCGRDRGGAVSIELAAHDGPADRAATISLSRRGNVVAALTATDSEEGALCRLVFEHPIDGGRLIVDADGVHLS